MSAIVIRPGRLPRGSGQHEHGWIVGVVILLLVGAVCGFTLVWLNIESMDKTFFINSNQARVSEKLALRDKLIAERERLVSPNELLPRARRFGMRDPKPGQIRCMQDTP